MFFVISVTKGVLKALLWKSLRENVCLPSGGFFPGGGAGEGGACVSFSFTIYKWRKFPTKVILPGLKPYSIYQFLKMLFLWRI